MNKKLNVLFIASWYPTKVSPFNGDFVQRHAEAIATKHIVDVIHVITDESLKKHKVEVFIKNNVTTRIIYVPRIKNNLWRFFVFFNAYLTAFKTLSRIDIVHLNVIYPKGIIALYLKWFKKIPFIISEHWTGYLPLSKTKHKKISILLTKFISIRANYICPVSNELKTAMDEIGIKGNYKIVANVVDINLFKPINKQKNKFTITHISSFNDAQKNISGILKVIEQLSIERQDFIFKIIGNGDLTELQDKINQFNIPQNLIQIEGAKNPEEIATILQNSNVSISFSNYETFGIVMIESLACGVPVITTKTGILYELNLTKYSKIINMNNEKELFDAIVFYYDSSDEINKNEMHNFVADNFSIKTISTAFSNLYYNALSSE